MWVLCFDDIDMVAITPANYRMLFKACDLNGDLKITDKESPEWVQDFDQDKDHTVKLWETLDWLSKQSAYVAQADQIKQLKAQHVATQTWLDEAWVQDYFPTGTPKSLQYDILHFFAPMVSLHADVRTCLRRLKQAGVLDVAVLPALARFFNLLDEIRNTYLSASQWTVDAVLTGLETLVIRGTPFMTQALPDSMLVHQFAKNLSMASVVDAEKMAGEWKALITLRTPDEALNHFLAQAQVHAWQRDAALQDRFPADCPEGSRQSLLLILAPLCHDRQELEGALAQLNALGLLHAGAVIDFLKFLATVNEVLVMDGTTVLLNLPALCEGLQDLSRRGLQFMHAALADERTTLLFASYLKDRWTYLGTGSPLIRELFDIEFDGQKLSLEVMLTLFSVIPEARVQANVFNDFAYCLNVAYPALGAPLAINLHAQDFKGMAVPLGFWSGLRQVAEQGHQALLQDLFGEVAFQTVQVSMPAPDLLLPELAELQINGAPIDAACFAALLHLEYPKDPLVLAFLANFYPQWSRGPWATDSLSLTRALLLFQTFVKEKVSPEQALADVQQLYDQEPPGSSPSFSLLLDDEGSRVTLAQFFLKGWTADQIATLYRRIEEWTDTLPGVSREIFCALKPWAILPYEAFKIEFEAVAERQFVMSLYGAYALEFRTKEQAIDFDDAKVQPHAGSDDVTLYELYGQDLRGLLVQMPQLETALIGQIRSFWSALEPIAQWNATQRVEWRAMLKGLPVTRDAEALLALLVATRTAGLTVSERMTLARYHAQGRRDIVVDASRHQCNEELWLYANLGDKVMRRYHLPDLTWFPPGVIAELAQNVRDPKHKEGQPVVMAVFAVADYNGAFSPAAAADEFWQPLLDTGYRFELYQVAYDRAWVHPSYYRAIRKAGMQGPIKIFVEAGHGSRWGLWLGDKPEDRQGIKPRDRVELIDIGDKFLERLRPYFSDDAQMISFSCSTNKTGGKYSGENVARWNARVLDIEELFAPYRSAVMPSIEIDPVTKRIVTVNDKAGSYHLYQTKTPVPSP